MDAKLAIAVAVGASMVLASRGMAQPADRRAIEADTPPAAPAADGTTWRRDGIGPGIARLQPAGALGKPRSVVRGRGQAALPSNEDSAAVSTESFGLRLEPSLRTRLPQAGAAIVTPAVPGQALNLEGLVPASRMQVRDGVIVLEGDVTTQPAVPTPDGSSMRGAPSESAVQVMRKD